VSAAVLMVDYDSPTYGTVKLRYCGTLHMPSAYANEHSFEGFLQYHPHKALSGIVTLIAHTPSGQEQVKIEGQPPSESCLDVWAACLEDNIQEKGLRRVPGIYLVQLEKWRASTNDFRKDELVSSRRPSLSHEDGSRPRHSM
jgi:hypothetical protein